MKKLKIIILVIPIITFTTLGFLKASQPSSLEGELFNQVLLNQNEEYPLITDFPDVYKIAYDMAFNRAMELSISAPGFIGISVTADFYYR